MSKPKFYALDMFPYPRRAPAARTALVPPPPTAAASCPLAAPETRLKPGSRSGAGLHVGHPEGYTATDIIARYKVATTPQAPLTLAFPPSPAPPTSPNVTPIPPQNPAHDRAQRDAPHGLGRVRPPS